MANFLEYDPYAHSEIVGWISEANNPFSSLYSPKSHPTTASQEDTTKTTSNLLKVL
jgi:hypothetical protein